MRKFNFNIDIEDNERQNSLSKSKYNSITLKELYDLDWYTIDLGLPSETRWCKYNLGCDFDLLNTHPENTKLNDWEGLYYEWADILPHDSCLTLRIVGKEMKNYKYAIDTFKSLTKYCNNFAYGHNRYSDNLTLLLPEDDAAYLNMDAGNLKFHTPTKELFEELLEYTNLSTFIKDYNNIINLHGFELTSKINRNKIFLNSWSGLVYDNDFGFFGNINFWTSTLNKNNPSLAYYLSIDIYSTSLLFKIYRNQKMSIRPVINLK